METKTRITIETNAQQIEDVWIDHEKDNFREDLPAKILISHANNWQHRGKQNQTGDRSKKFYLIY